MSTLPSLKHERLLRICLAILPSRTRIVLSCCSMSILSP